MDVAGGLDASGRLVAWTHHAATFHLSMFGAYKADEDPEGNPWGGYDNPYDIPNVAVAWSEIESPIPTGAWRAVYYPANVFARESFLDELAGRAGRDPLAFRLAMLGGSAPAAVDRQRFDRPGLARVLRLAAEKAGWGSPLTKRAGRRSGRGLACNVYDGGTLIAQVAEVSVGSGGDVAVHRVVTAVDCGRAVNPLGVEGQVESGVIWGLSYALKGDVTISGGRVVQTGFADYPLMTLAEMPDARDDHRPLRGRRAHGNGRDPGALRGSGRRKRPLRRGEEASPAPARPPGRPLARCCVALPS